MTLDLSRCPWPVSYTHLDVYKRQELSERNFDQEVLQSELPVLVEFWAPWCGHCRMVGPIIEELAGDYQGRLKVCKLNVDQEMCIRDRGRGHDQAHF